MKKTFALIIATLSIAFISCKGDEPLPKDPPKGFISFGFSKDVNPVLSEDIVCRINSDGTITGEFVDLMIDYTLIPTFETDAKNVSVASMTQVSGTTAQNFSRKVIYNLLMEDGSHKNYAVIMTFPQRPQIPTIAITTKNGAAIKDKKNYIPGTVVISDPDGLYWDKKELILEMTEDGIRGRGNTTWDMPKKPYKLKFDEKVSIFGLAADKEWVILANYADKTLLRNVVAMKLSEILGMAWTPAMLPVEVYLNGKYLGCYTFSEHKKVAKGRVNLDIVGEDDNEGDAVTGDYYFEIESRMDETTCFRTPVRNLPMMFADPEVPTEAQFEYVYNYFGDAERALNSDNFTDPENGWQKYIDAESFAKTFIVNELTKNVDGNMRKSSFITKQKGKKLEMYHLWDYDITLGNCNYINLYGGTNGPEGWFIKTVSLDGGENWFIRLCEDPAFCATVKRIWDEHYNEIAAIPHFIDQQANFIYDAQKRNFERWDILSVQVWPNVVVTGDYIKEIDYMKDFYKKRMTWLDAAFNVSEGEIFK